ncbi:MAG: sirohydrochlorin cobaltochelatase [Desulfurivibrio sp.]|nr:sirohydrochlorin cobaltochelatase [Desulfurivibrio sp.]
MNTRLNQTSPPTANPTRRLLGAAMVLLLAVAILPPPAARAGGKVNVVPEEPAIVLAVFGTSYPEALPGILTIYHEVREAYPETTVRLAFTSNIIRRIWHKRRDDARFRRQHPEIPATIYQVKAPLATIANLVDEDYGQIVVQPTHIAAAEEFHDLKAVVDALNNIRTIKERNRPFRQLVLGRPALGAPGIGHPYREDLAKAAAALADDVQQARDEDSALVYMAHGNQYFSTGVFMELEHLMRQLYPEVDTYLAQESGFPDLELLVQRLVDDGVEQALLVPLMTVAGDHARNDLAGSADDSLQSRLTAAGIKSRAQLVGLGEKRRFARLFVDHLGEAAAGAAIDLQ